MQNPPQHFIRNHQASNPKQVQNTILAERMEDLKEHSVEVFDMCEAAEKFAQEYAKKVAKEVTEKNHLESVRNLMKNLGLSAERAMEALNIPKQDFPRYLSML